VHLLNALKARTPCIFIVVFNLEEKERVKGKKREEEKRKGDKKSQKERTPSFQDLIPIPHPMPAQVEKKRKHKSIKHRDPEQVTKRQNSIPPLDFSNFW